METVVFSVSRNVDVRASCRFEAEAKASRRREDCDSMYCNESVALDSRAVNRLCIDLKKDSCVAGGVEVGIVEVVVDEEADEAIGETDGETGEYDAEADVGRTVAEEAVNGFDTTNVLLDEC